MALSIFKPPGPLEISDKVSEDWNLFKEQFLLFLKATESDSKSDEIKVAQLLNVIGHEALAIFHTFKLGELKTLKLDDVIKAFDKHFVQAKNIVYQRFLFFKRYQHANEPFLHFYTDLKKLGSYCDFGEQEDSLIRDRIVLCIREEALQERLLREANLKLADAVKYCQLAEKGKEQLFDVIKDKSVHQVGKKEDLWTSSGYNKTNSVGPELKEEVVHAIGHSSSTKRFGSNNYSKNVQSDYRSRNVNFNDRPTRPNIYVNNEGGFRPNQNQFICKRCNFSHAKGVCRAYGKKCSKCGGLNHFAVCCKTVKFKHELRPSLKREVNEVGLSIVEENHPSFNIAGIHSVNSCMEQDTNAWYKTLIINGNLIKFKLDTGAEINLISSEVLKCCNIFEIDRNCSIKLESYGGFKLDVVGKINVLCQFNDDEALIEFVVVQNRQCIPILGLKTCVDLGLVKRVCDVSSISKEEFIRNNNDVFTGIGCFPTEYTIKLKENSMPIVRAPRRVPQSILPKLKDTLDKMEELKIIEKNDCPTSYVSNLVLVEKPDKSLRICLDPQSLNKDIKPEPYLIPTMDDLKANLAGQKYFTVLDLKDGFFHVKLDTESSNICTFSSPYGCYSFRRLPFGLSIAPQLFQKLNSRIFSDIKGVTVYFDDLLIAAPSEQSHDDILEQVLNKARENGVKFNPRKVQYRMNSVNFVGHIFSSNGVSIDDKHIEAVVNIPNPTCKKELQRVLGMFNYFRDYIPQMSTIISPLRDLLKSSTCWEWLPIHSTSINTLKNALTSAPVLAAFDSNKQIEVHADSSKDAVGFCLLQEGKPVSFGSRSLTSAETQYAQVEKELLSVYVAVTKYHNLLYGRKFVVYNDSKPIESVMKKPIDKIMSPRLQRLRLKLLKYDITIKYRPGNKMVVADLLSRTKYSHEQNEIGLMSHNRVGLVNTVDVVVQNELAISEDKKIEFRKATLTDPALSVICNYYVEGWPDKRQVPEQVKVFYNKRFDLFVSDGLVFLNDKIVVPYSLRPSMLKLLHSNHFGIDKTKSRAREVMYWPNITADIENLVINCQSCNKYMNAQVKETLHSHEVPDLPFSKLAMDIAEIGPNIYLIVVDYFSKWIECVSMNAKTTSEVIRHLKTIFTTHGIPVQVVADNNPFGSFQFKQFAQEWGFDVINTSPLYPRSNGQVERSVQVMKKMLKKCSDSKDDFHLALMEYRNTPVVNGWSPAQMLMSRRLRTKIPVSKKLLKPNSCNTELVRQTIINDKLKSAKYYNQSAKPKPVFKVDDEVYVYHLFKRIWEPGVIVGVVFTPRSYMVKMYKSGMVLRRNSSHLRHKLSRPTEHDVVENDNRPIVSESNSGYNPSLALSPLGKPVHVDLPREESRPSINSSPNKTVLREQNSPNERNSSIETFSKSPRAPQINRYQTRSGRISRLPKRLDDYKME